MGSKRTLADPASQSAAEVQAGPPAAAAAADPQPSSSEQPFVNTGLLTWLERRRQWTHKPPEFKRTSRKRAFSPSVTPEQVLSFTPFPKPVALQEVIEVLQDVWDQEDYF